MGLDQGDLYAGLVEGKQGGGESGLVLLESLDMGGGLLVFNVLREDLGGIQNV